MRIAKKLLAMTVVLAMVLGLTSTALFANSDISVVVDGYEVQFEDQGPIMQGGRVLAPVRGVFTQMGFVPNWNGSDRVATLTGDGITVVIPADGVHFYVNGQTVIPDVPQMMLSGRIMLPVSAIAEAVGATASWDPATRVVTISTAEEAIPADDEDYDEQDEDYDEEDEDYDEEDEDYDEQDEDYDEEDEDYDEEDEDYNDEDEDYNDEDNDDEDEDNDDDDDDDEDDDEDEEDNE
ncbi:MAG: copper amine oxidase N-terminal domain-containing protein [Defluviitaleaceae bacterium]|nr:copper amine oxidase N-terminal domain-containing protein [Defluviitaleaceae bacterium]